MKKFTKSLLTLGLLVGLAACGGGDDPSPTPSPEPQPAETFTVSFWLTDTGHYKDVDVEKGKAVEAPADPTRDGYEFLGWTEQGVEELYDLTKAVNADLDLYAKWEVLFSADPLSYTLVGNLQNSDYAEHEWDTETEVLMMQRTAEDKNEFAITVDLGYNAEIKVKSFEPGWNDNYNYGASAFTTIDDPANYGPIDYEAELKQDNLVIKNAGNYEIVLTTNVVAGVTMGNEARVKITRLGDPLDPTKVTANPDPDAAFEWRLVGSVPWSNWTNTADAPKFEGEGTNEALQEYKSGNLFLVEGDEFKLTVDAAWDGEVGYGTFGDVFGAGDVYGEGDTLPEGAVVGDPKLGSNNVVLDTGYYQFTVKAVDPTVPRAEMTWTFEAAYYGMDELEIIGTATPGGWEAGTPMVADALNPVIVDRVVNEEGVVTEEGSLTYTYTYEGLTTTEADQEYKVRSAGGWNFDFGNPETGVDNMVIAEPGTYNVTLVVTVNLTTRVVTHTLAHVAVEA